MSLDNITGLGRAAQAAGFLDRARELLQSLDGHTMAPSTLLRFTRIDLDIQSFLSLVLEQCRGTWALYCCSVATALK